MHNRSKKALILAVWMILLGISGVVLAITENSLSRQKALYDLENEAKAVSGQMKRIVRAEFLVRKEMDNAQLSRVKALAFALEEKNEILQTDPLLNEFAVDPGVTQLVVYSREGMKLFNSGVEADLSPEAVRSMLKTRSYGQQDQEMQSRETMTGMAFAAGGPAEQDVFRWGTSDGNLLISMHVNQRENDKRLSASFDWRNVLQDIQIGRTGRILALDKEQGTILSYADTNRFGDAYDTLSVRLADGDRALPFTELKERLAGSDEAIRIRIAGDICYARRVANDDTLSLALLPEKEIRDAAAGEVGMLMSLLVLVTGICVIFVMFHLRDSEEIHPRWNGRIGWRETLAARLKVVGVLAVAAVMIAGLYLGSLAAYAETFRYTRSKADNIVKLFEKNDGIRNMLENSFGYFLQTKCETADAIIRNTEPEKLTREYLSILADRLDVQYIGIYDGNGKLTATNAPYFEETMKEDDPFHVLLDGKLSLTGNLEWEWTGSNGLVRLIKSGLALQDEKGMPDGLIMLATGSDDMVEVMNYLDSEKMINRTVMADEATVIAIDDTDKWVILVAEMDEGNQLASLNHMDVIGHHIQDLGISEAVLRDRFNGNVSIMNNQYFASVCRVDDIWLMVMLPQASLDARYLIPITISTGAALLFAVLLILCACIARKEQIGTEAGIPEAEPEKEKTEPSGTIKAHQAEKDDDTLAILGNLVYRKKPYFEERWPNDCIPWKNRSTSSHFRTILRWILVVSLGAIMIHTLTAGEDSIWYYCIKGEWDKGINLYSLTSCLLTACLLMVAKIVIHKLLYLIARAANAQGETICHLLDSFSDYFLWIAGVFICLANMGVEASTLSLTGGVAGVIFGIGCQNVVADILSGILMTFEGVARVGDFVSYNGNYAVVLSVGVRTTRLKWYGTITPVRNNEFKNFVYLTSDRETRVVVPLTVDMNEPLERVEKILEEEIPEIHRRLCETVNEEVTGPVYRGVQKFTDNGYVVSLAIFCRGKYFGWINRQLNRELKNMCDRRGIRLALPQVVVHGAGTPTDGTETGLPGRKE